MSKLPDLKWGEGCCGYTSDPCTTLAYGTLFNVQSVEQVTSDAFPGYGDFSWIWRLLLDMATSPGYGDFITHVWRVKQLEYSGLRSMMSQYADFWQVTKESFAFTLTALDLQPDAQLLEQIAETYNHLAPYPEARAAPEVLSDYRLAILSNGNRDMLRALVANNGMGDLIGAIMSVDAKQVYKPDARAYELVEEQLGVPRATFCSYLPTDSISVVPRVSASRLRV
jgi:2-haloacid dehalogenase